MPYILITVQSGGWDPALPLHLDYSPDLDPEIHGFLREQSRLGRRGLVQSGSGSAQTECELRRVLDGLEKLGFNLVTTSSYNFNGRSYNEFILHRELTPTEINPAFLLHQRHEQSTNPKSGGNNKQRHSHSTSSSSNNRGYAR